MKKIMLSLALVGTALGAQAQIAAGTKLLSGSIGYSETENKSENSSFFNRSSKTQTFNFTPTVGYFVAENLAVGVNLDFTSARTKGNDVFLDYTSQFPTPTPYEFDRKMRTINAGAFVRYYKFVGEKAAFFGQAGAGYSNYYSSEAARSNKQRPQGFYGNLLPGFTFFPTNKFALELTARGLAYDRTSTRVARAANGTDYLKTVQHNLDLGFGLQDLRLGASFYLGR